MKKENGKTVRSVHFGWLVGALLATALGCSSSQKDVDIGGGMTGEKLSDYSARWEGYVELYPFSDGSDRVVLTLNRDGGGVLTVGNSPSPNLADPDVWPLSDGLQPGVEYAVKSAIVEEKRLRLKLDTSGVARSWCALQTPVLDESNSTSTDRFYRCVPNVGTSGDSEHCFLETQPPTPINCGKLFMCDVGGSCVCTEDGCTAREGTPAQLDAAWTDGGDTLSGTLAEAEQRTLRLYRVQ